MAANKPLTAELAQFNLGVTIEWIKFAEGKAAVLLMIATALLGASLTEVPLATKVIVQTWPKVSTASAVLIGFHSLFYGLLIWSIWSALSVVRPKLLPASNRHSWFFFQSMSLLSPADYKGFCNALTDEHVLEQLCDQIYNNAKVARQKFAEVKKAINLLVAACCFGMFGVFPVLVLEGIHGSK